VSNYAETRLAHGEKWPYHSKPPTDWAERAALGVLADLMDRRGIKQELRQIEGDEDITQEIVITLADIIRTAARTAANR
jgi:hypothetical protein